MTTIQNKICRALSVAVSVQALSNQTAMLSDTQKPDYEHWSRLAFWTLEETISLCCDIEPGFTEEKLNIDFIKLDRLIRRAAETGVFAVPVKPAEFTLWVTANRIAFPADLQRHVLTRSDSWVDWKAEARRYKETAEQAVEGFEHYRASARAAQSRVVYLEEELHHLRRGEQKARYAESAPVISPKSFKSLLRLVGGMAVAIYNFDPTESRSDVVSQIQSDLDLKGINMDADTIRKWVREGAKLINTGE